MVAMWVKRADLDLAVANRLLGEEETFRDIVGFHCQQAVEKYLKAALVHHQIEFPRTHDIERLLRILDAVEPQLADAASDAKWLTPFAVEFRYPGDTPEMLPGDANRAIELADRVRNAIVGVLLPRSPSD
jgi:HEPN domain-containing protein